MLVQAESGVVSVTGTRGGAGEGRHLDRRHRVGHVRVCVDPRRAVRARAAPAQGTRIDVSMFEAHGRVDEPSALLHAFGGTRAAAQRAGSRDDRAVRALPRRRRQHVMFGIQNEREWATFCGGVLRQPALATDARYDTNTKRTRAPRGSHRADRKRISHAHRGTGRRGSTPRASPTRASTRRRKCGSIRSSRRASAGAKSARRPADLPALLPPATMSGFEARHGPDSRGRRAHRSHPRRASATAPTTSRSCAPRTAVIDAPAGVCHE